MFLSRLGIDVTLYLARTIRHLDHKWMLNELPAIASWIQSLDSRQEGIPSVADPEAIVVTAVDHTSAYEIAFRWRDRSSFKLAQAPGCDTSSVRIRAGAANRANFSGMEPASVCCDMIPRDSFVDFFVPLIKGDSTPCSGSHLVVFEELPMVLLNAAMSDSLGQLGTVGTTFPQWRSC